MSVLEKFLDCVSFDTASCDDGKSCPSTGGQKVLGEHLAQRMKDIGIADAHMDEFGYVYGTIHATSPKAKTVGFLAHLDTSPEISGKNVKPRVIENYDGQDIVLNRELGIVTAVKDFPAIKELKGKTLIVTDGTTLLGADDKAGIAEILQAAEEIIAENKAHGTIKLAFTPDEEVGSGPDKFDVPGFGADFAYTVDGGPLGELEYENFNGASAKLSFKGRSVHPGSAKNKMLNPMKLAMEFNAMLPASEVPEHTEGYEGFSHLVHMHGNIEEAQLSYIIRDHDSDLLELKKENFRRIADYMNSKYSPDTVKLEIADSYRNMKEQILPHMEIIELAKQAMEENGVEPRIIPIRGGTDGARLSFMGLPCPNLCTGGQNAHGRHELAVVEEMEAIKNIIKSIALNLVK